MYLHICVCACRENIVDCIQKTQSKNKMLLISIIFLTNRQSSHIHKKNNNKNTHWTFKLLVALQLILEKNNLLTS